MKDYECLAEILPDGYLSIPESMMGKLSGESKIRVMILLDDEETSWNNFAMSKFMKDYSAKDAVCDSL